MTYLIFLVAGLGVLWLSRKAKDDIPLIGTSVSGIILLIWGFSTAPSALQIAIELLTIGIAFSLCVRCCNSPS